MKKTNEKLQLNRETIAQLTTPELSKVLGGAIQPKRDSFKPSQLICCML